MIIIRLSVYVVKLDVWSVGTHYTDNDQLGFNLQSSIVCLETDCGLTGWGETLTPPPYYHPTSPQIWYNYTFCEIGDYLISCQGVC